MPADAAGVRLILVGTVPPDVRAELERLGPATEILLPQVRADRLRALFNAADVAIFTTFTVSYWESHATGLRLVVPATEFTRLAFDGDAAVTAFGTADLFSIADEEYRPGDRPGAAHRAGAGARSGSRRARFPNDVFVDGSGAAAVRPLPEDCDSAGGGAGGRRWGRGAGMSVTVATAAPVRTSLGGTAVRGVAWLFAQNVGTRFMVLAGQMLLARLLAPADFGVFGLAGTVVNVVSMVGDFGVQDVVLQRQRALRHWLTPAFWTSALLGGAGLALVLFVAPLLARLYGAAELPAMLALMGLAIPLTALANVPCILLRAQLRFRDLAMMGGAEVVGVQVLTVAFATARMGPYSFVLPLPIVALVRTATLWFATRPTIGRPRLARVRKILARGSHLLGTKVITAAVSQGDYFVLGLFTSKAAVGVYYFAFRLAVQPLQLLATSVTNVVFPVLAQMGSDQARQRAAALAAARVLAYVAMPCCFLQAALAEPVVRLLAGHKWDAAVPIAQVLSVGLAFDAVAWIAGAVLRARGEFFSTFKYIGLCAVGSSLWW